MKRVKNYKTRMDEANKNYKIKSITDFDELNCNSIKSVAVKQNNSVKVTTTFIKGKLLMFAKVSLKSFVYSVADVFCFPSPKVINIYQRNDIIKRFLYLLLIDTDSCSLQFMFVCKLSSTISEKKSRDLIFEIMSQSKTKQRLDTSDEFYNLFNTSDITLKKHVGLYQVQSINNLNILAIAVNPKECFELFCNKKFNKKHKGIRKETRGMMFEAHAERIMDLREYTDLHKKPKQFIQQRFQIKNTNMQMTAIKKAQFSSLNDKRYYFSDGICSLPYGHIFLFDVRNKEKKNIKQYIKNSRN